MTLSCGCVSFHGNQRSNFQHLLDHRESKGIPEKYLLSLHWLCGSLRLCGSQQTGKFLKRWEYQTTLTCLLRNLSAGQEATVRTRCGTTNWFKFEKGVYWGCVLSPCLFNLYAEYIRRNVGVEDSQSGIKIAGRSINNLRYADNTTLMAERWRGTKWILDEGKKGEWKSWLKTQLSEN